MMTFSMHYNKLSIAYQNSVAVITLDNPPVNSLSASLVEELTQAASEVNELAASGDVRALILTGEGEHFCAGADLKERAEMSEDEVRETVRKIRMAVEAVWEVRIPVLAAIGGAAFGGGMEITLAADMRILSDDALFGLKEVKLGIMPGAWGTQLLGRIVGLGRALEWITTGRNISAEEAYNSGLANAVVPRKDLMEQSMEIAGVIASNGPVGVQSAKRAVREGLDMPLRDALEVEWKEYCKTIQTEDRVEGLRAFLEKRKPEFSGR